jgi:thymidylate synthase
MNSLDRQYTDLLQDILENGVRKEDRTGTGTISVFGRQIRHKMSEGFPLLTTKKMAFKTMVTELLWFLRGDTNIKFLVDNNCHIWDGDAYNNYGKRMVDIINVVIPAEFMDKGWVKLDNHGKYGVLSKEEFINKIKTDDEFAERWGYLGPIYGKQWRKWGIDRIDFNTGDPIYIDQIANLINDLKTKPDSRRLMVNSWNVGELDSMILPPCHYGFQVYTRELSEQERFEKWWIEYFNTPVDYIHSTYAMDIWEKEHSKSYPTRAISLMWNQRSVDTFLGLPFNIASYGLLLEIIAKEVNMVPDELIGNLGDVHLYSNHIEQAKEQIGRELTFQERIKLVEGHKEIYGAMSPFSSNDGIMRLCDEHSIAKRTREPYPLPKLILDDWYSTQGDPSNTPKDISEFLKNIHVSHIKIEKYQSHPSIKAPLSN